MATKPKTISGYATKFNLRSQNLGPASAPWFEIVKPGAFKQTLANDDIRCLWNHQSQFVLGRTSAGTLNIREDSIGLFYECTLPTDCQFADDFWACIECGNVTQNSFAFRLGDTGSRMTKASDGSYVRELLAVTLMEISPCTFPAYTDTSVNAFRNTNEMYMDRQKQIEFEIKMPQYMKDALKRQHKLELEMGVGSNTAYIPLKGIPLESVGNNRTEIR